MKYLDMNRYKRSMGTMAMERPVKSRSHLVECCPMKLDRPTGRVLNLSDWIKTSGKKKSFQMGTAL